MTQTRAITLLQQQVASLVLQYGYIEVRRALSEHAAHVLDNQRAAELKRLIDETNVTRLIAKGDRL